MICLGSTSIVRARKWTKIIKEDLTPYRGVKTPKLMWAFNAEKMCYVKEETKIGDLVTTANGKVGVVTNIRNNSAMDCMAFRQ